MSFNVLSSVLVGNSRRSWRDELAILGHLLGVEFEMRDRTFVGGRPGHPKGVYKSQRVWLKTFQHKTIRRLSLHPYRTFSPNMSLQAKLEKARQSETPENRAVVPLIPPTLKEVKLDNIQGDVYPTFAKVGTYYTR